jgi:hypothetical protein
MRIIILAVLLLSGLGFYAYAPAGDRPPALVISADSITKQPVHGYDGVVRPGPAEFVTTAVGNVEIVVSGIEITADSASWHSSSNEIELSNGVARIKMPARIDMLRVPGERP